MESWLGTGKRRTTGRLVAVSAAAGLLMVGGGCGREWLPEPGRPCVLEKDCPEGYVCFNGRCMELGYTSIDGGVRLKEFGERCEDNEACKSGYCLPHPEGGICTEPCAIGCPPGWVCKNVVNPRESTSRLGLCAFDQNRLCKPCTNDLDCQPAGSDRCVQVAEGVYCLTDCWYEDCPPGYDCIDVAHESSILRQCWPSNATCICTAATVGMVRSCERSNQLGACSGYEQCLPPAGWTNCSAREPSGEDCNGIDDDCNGLVDEYLEGKSCTVKNYFGSCPGEEECRGWDGWVCGAPAPDREVCDGQDNNCDGRVDEDFLDGYGRYHTDEHCGGCGVDCSVMIPHAAESKCMLVDGVAACRAIECEPGFYVYAAGLACLLLPANLCQSCSSDEECLAPGSRCIENGTERYCGRDCQPSSPYGAGCPTGYRCLPYGASLQCQPDTDTCLCAAETVGTVRSCLVETCMGYQQCEQAGALFRWTLCNVVDYNPEVCDGLDNNCNQQVDEGYLNPVSGRYENDQHCGFCNNDCSLYWSEALDHTTGVCDTSALPMPRCVMGPCSTEVVDGVAYEWVDVNREAQDGCECRRILGNTDTDPPDLIGDPAPGLVYADENCDGMDGVMVDALFVRAGSVGGDGSLPHPYSSISQAVAAFFTSGKSYLLVAEGSYHENLALVAGVKLHGGYSADFLSRDVVLYASVVKGTDPNGALGASGLAGGLPTLLSGFVIYGRNLDEAPKENIDGFPSVAVAIKDCDDSLVLRSNVIVSGRGGAGGRGSTGEAGFGRQVSSQLTGGEGQDGLRLSGSCPVASRSLGGGGGINQACPGVNGNPGGTSFCPQFDWLATPYQGAQAQYTTTAFGNGLGGYDWSFDRLSTSECSHATESGYPSNIQLNVGQDGQDGTDGANGLGGGGGAGRYGSISGENWVHAPAGATPGTTGAYGQGGGGGGAGGGTARYYRGLGDCDRYEIGPSGGGGGAGGCGGQGGQMGRAGGASVAVMVVFSQAADVNPPVLVHNLIQRGPGGRGGDGGFGGMGGLGGVGGFGGLWPDWVSSLGGKGGDGGNGGPGGGGGGGVGGPSYGVLGFNIPVDQYVGGNTFIYDDTVPTGGLGGAGGGSVGPGASGMAGESGAYRNLLGLFSCSLGSCPAGFFCDGNQVCLPAD